MMTIEHVFFDLDHTLWDFERNSAKTFDFILKENKINVDLDNFLGYYAPINKKYWKLYREEKIRKPALRYRRLKDTFDALEHAISDRQIDHLAKVYIENLPNYNHLFQDTIEILEYLLPNYKLHVITNGFEEIQVQKMKNSEIHHFFDKIITSESVGVKKPNPKIFHHALDLASTVPEKSMMIGDNLEADIAGAAEVGMRTLFFNDTDEKISGDTTRITKLIEIKQHL